MEFLDRTEELAELKRVLFGKTTGRLIVVYGRRRLGKSTLIKRALEKEDIYYMAGDFIKTLQMDMFSQQLAERFPEMGYAKFSEWEEIFLMLNALAGERFNLCLDEFPYMVKHSPELPSILQRLIDSGSLKYNIVICGSSQRMMQEMVLGQSEPLYGRAHAIIKVMPIPISFLQEALHLDPVSTIEEYSVWGGVPRYWELREEFNSLKETIKTTLLTPTGVLYDEPKRLFLDDMLSTVQSESLLSVVASGACRLSEIGARMNRDSTALSLPIDKLIQMGYLRREIPFGDSPKKSKKGIYKINDPMMDFYYTFIVPNMSSIGRGRKTYVEEEIEARFDEYVARHWEHLCQEAVSGNRLFGSLWEESSRWWGSVKIGSEIHSMEFDVMALSSDQESLLVGECKWTNPEVAANIHAALVEKASRLPWAAGKEIVPVLFLKHHPKDLESVHGISILYPEDVVRMAFG